MACGMFWTCEPSSPSPSTYQGLRDDMDKWPCDTWDIYYERNKAIYGRAKAVEIVTIDAERVGMFAELHWCKYDCDFIRKWVGEGFNVGGIISDIACVISDVTGTVETTTHNASKYGKLIVPAGIALGAWWIYTQIDE